MSGGTLTARGTIGEPGRRRSAISKRGAGMTEPRKVTSGFPEVRHSRNGRSPGDTPLGHPTRGKRSERIGARDGLRGLQVLQGFWAGCQLRWAGCQLREEPLHFSQSPILRKTTASSPASPSPARCRIFSGALSTGCTGLEFTHKPAGPEGPAETESQREGEEVPAAARVSAPVSARYKCSLSPRGCSVGNARR